jgi:ribosomal protein L11 methyltransferase
MPTYLLTLDVARPRAQALADLLAERPDLGADASGCFDLGGGMWRVEAYFGAPPDLGVLSEASGLATLKTTARVRPLAEEDFAAWGLDTLPPVTAGRFRVFGEHNRPDPNALRACDLIIEASTAFGSGDHASTRLALMALDQTMKRRRPTTILDVGCGTGVLAIAALKAGAGRAIASDIDAVAVRTTRRNARAMGVAPRLTTVEAAGLDHPALRGTYPIVVANILPDPLCAMAGPLARAVAPGGSLILAGLRVGERARLLSAYAAQGLVLTESQSIKEWMGLTLRRRTGVHA